MNTLALFKGPIRAGLRPGLRRKTHQRASQELCGAFRLVGRSAADGVCGLRHQYSFQSPGAAERNAAYPTSGTLLVRATGTRANGRDMQA